MKTPDDTFSDIAGAREKASQVPSAVNRRRLLRVLGGFAATTVAARGLSSERETPAGEPAKSSGSKARPGKRSDRAYRMRVEAAEQQRKDPPGSSKTNGDDERYSSRIASYSKGLPHNAIGEVEPKAYEALVRAMQNEDYDALEQLPLAGARKLENPQAASTFDMEGPDSHQVSLATPPAFSSAEQAAEAGELYWQAVTRDVAFAEYETDPLTIQAAADLSRFSEFRGPRVDGRVTPGTLFRDTARGDLVGPYISQFLYKSIPYGAMLVNQQMRALVPALDYMITVPEWLAVQNGALAREARPDPNPRYIRSSRDLAEFVHQDFTYQAFLSAALILLGLPAPLDYGNPYRRSVTQSGFATFGGPAVLDMVTRVANCSLKAAWYQKWILHRRLRPEEFGGRVHLARSDGASYPIHPELFNSPVLDHVFTKNRSYLLPQAYPEGSPLHPSYPAGHGAIAGACTTVLKAFFDESFVITDPVTTSGDCLSLHKYRGPALTVGGELNKLASNIATGRNMAGIHWRTDGTEGLNLGEAVAVGVLRDFKSCYSERFSGFSLTRFDGTTISV